MATANRNRVRLPPARTRCTDFSKVGGLGQHIKLLRDLIIVPLLYGDVYMNLNINAPRGLLFYGPPGTGKTLVAGALANELNNQSKGNKVSFFQRKGADILDKWVGESERKLRELFDKATKNRPAIIFFDEIDGLAPERSQKNDQVHCSVVATLLALMDGLDNMPGVIVIGATNRIDAIDPALRRPGRFDRELYFPLPNHIARREILQVHMQSWKFKPGSDFINRLAELTTGYCGSDLQALCSESVLCCLKRLYPNINKPMLGKIDINLDTVKVDEIDFLAAIMNLTPTGQRLGNVKMRRLSPFIRPLLQRQLDKIKYYLNIFLPHFVQPNKKYLMVGNDRYLGRLVLKGSNQQGVNMHIIPALLQALEHLPSYVLDIPTLFERNIRCAQQNLPSILLMSRVDDWWEIIDNTTQMGITAMLQDLHAGIPLLIIATCNKELPALLKEYFYNNSSIVIDIENPKKEEKEKFLWPLFYSTTRDISIIQVLEKCSSQPKLDKKVDPSNPSLRKLASPKSYHVRFSQENTDRLRAGGSIADEKKLKGKAAKRKYPMMMEPRHLLPPKKKPKLSGHAICERSATPNNSCERTISPIKNYSLVYQNYLKQRQPESKVSQKMRSSRSEVHSRPSTKSNFPLSINHSLSSWSKSGTPASLADSDSADQNNKFSVNMNDLLNCKNINQLMSNANTFSGSVTNIYHNPKVKEEHHSTTGLCEKVAGGAYVYGDSIDMDKTALFNMWQRTLDVVSDDLSISHLELLYDTITACTTMNKNNFGNLMHCLDEMLTNFEKSWENLSS